MVDEDVVKERNRDMASDGEKYKVKGNRDRKRDKDEKDHQHHHHHHRGRDKDKDKDKNISGDGGRDDRGGKYRHRDREEEEEAAGEREKVKQRERTKERVKDNKHKDRAENDKDKRERGREKTISRDERKTDSIDKEKAYYRKNNNNDYDCGGSKDDDKSTEEDKKDRDLAKGFHDNDDDINTKKYVAVPASHPVTSQLEERITKMKEERLKDRLKGASDVLSWVNKSRKLEEKRNATKEKALQLSKVFEEQDNIDQGDLEDEEAEQHTSKDLAGLKVLHGLDKVIEGGAVVLTLKDQNILANGDINEDVDMLENVEIGEQKQRDEAYGAAKKKSGIYVDKFTDDPGSEKKMLPQYDDAAKDEGVTLDELGRFSGEAGKKLDELRKRLQGVSTNSHFEDLSSSGKIASDYYTHEEMLQFKKPKKKKSLRRREKLDIDSLEAEAISTGLGLGDLGSRNDGKKQNTREEQEKSEAVKRQNAYQSAYAKAEEASKALRVEQTVTARQEDDENEIFADDDDDLRKSLDRARNLAMRKRNEDAKVGPQAVALLASSVLNNQTGEDPNPSSVEPQENKVVITEMEEFVWGLQLDEEVHKPDSIDAFMEDDDAPRASEDVKDETGVWTEISDSVEGKTSANQDEEEVNLDETIHEIPVGKGLSGALKLLKDRGTFKETVEWGGRNMDKKKSKLVGMHENDGAREIRIERTDEFGRIMTPKEAFRMISHKFHGKGPGKMKQEKRMKQYHEELKLKQMKNADTPSLSVERMREAQARLQTPYLVLSGHVKPGQTSDPRSGFATVEKDLHGGLTPMLGDQKVEHFLGIKRKAESGDLALQKKPKS